MDIQNIIKQLKAVKIPADFIDYVFEQSTVLTAYYFDFDKMLNIMFDNGLKVDDKFMINVYKFAVKVNYSDNIFNFFYDTKVKLTNEKIIKLLIFGGLTKYEAIIKLFESDYNKEKVTLFDDYIDFLLTKHEIEILTYYNSTIKPNIHNELSKSLLTKDYNRFINIVKTKLLNTNSYDINECFVLNLIKDDNFIEDYLIEKTILLIKAKSQQANFLNVERCLTNYLKTGVFESDFNVVIDDFLKGFGKCDNYYYIYFLKGFKIDGSKQFHKNLFNLSLKIDSIVTLTNIIEVNCEKKQENIINLEKIIKDSNYNIPLLFLFLIEKSKESSYYVSVEQQLKYLIKNYFDICLNSLKTAENKIIITGIKYLFDYNKEKSFEFVLSLAESKSKVVRNAVVETLSGYKKLEEYKKLLNSKKAQVREIGEKLIDSL